MATATELHRLKLAEERAQRDLDAVVQAIKDAIRKKDELFKVWMAANVAYTRAKIEADLKDQRKKM